MNTQKVVEHKAVDFNTLIDEFFNDMQNAQIKSFNQRVNEIQSHFPAAFHTEVRFSRGRGGRDGRRLDAFDVFDFVKHAIGNGVRKVKKGISEKVARPLKEVVETIKDEAKERIEDYVDKIQEVKEKIEQKEPCHDEIKDTEVVEIEEVVVVEIEEVEVVEIEEPEYSEIDVQ